MPRESLIQIYRSTTASNAPSLTAGELAVNIPDKKLFVGGTSGNITFLDASAHVTTVNGLTSAITITGSGAILQTVSGTTTTFGARLASSSATGVASFGNEFTVSAAGAVGLTSNYVKSVNGLTGAVVSIATTGSNTFTGLNTFNAGISASALTVAGGVTFSGNVSLGDLPTGLTADSNDYVRILNTGANNYRSGIYRSYKTLAGATSGVVCTTPADSGSNTVNTFEVTLEYYQTGFVPAVAVHKFWVVVSYTSFGTISDFDYTESIVKGSFTTLVPFTISTHSSGYSLNITAAAPANTGKFSGWAFLTTVRVY
jgi:hypothetical protein